MTHADSALHPHVAVYRQLIDAFNRNDLDTVSTLLAHDITYTIPGRSPIACQTHGINEHVAVLRRARELSNLTLRFVPHTILADDEYLVAYGRITAERVGKRLDSDHCVLFRFSGDRIVEGRTVPVDLYQFDEFWSDVSPGVGDPPARKPVESFGQR